MKGAALFRYVERLRVRWAEIDAQKIVFNGHYLMYFDTAMGGYWRALALPYVDTLAQLGGDLFVRKASLEYHASARYDDRLDVGMRCARIGNSSLVFEGSVSCEGRQLVSGELVYVYADPQSQTSRPVPQSLREVMLAFEAGEAMTQVRTGDAQTLGVLARRLRQQVFVDERQAPAPVGWDAADNDALHALVLNRLGQPLATGRLLSPVAGAGRIGRMAVIQPVRGSGIGRRLLEALVDAARARGDHAVMLQAHASATAFYERSGFTASTVMTRQDGLDQVEMTRAL